MKKKSNKVTRMAIAAALSKEKAKRNPISDEQVKKSIDRNKELNERARQLSKSKNPATIEKGYTYMTQDSFHGLPYTTIHTVTNTEKADKTYQHPNTIVARYSCETTNNKNEINQVLSLQHEYSSVDDMILQNPHLVERYSHFLTFMRRLESYIGSWIDGLCTISLGYNKDPMMSLFGLESFEMKVQGKTDAINFTFNYCADEFNVPMAVPRGRIIYEGELHFSLTQSFAKNMAKQVTYNIAFDKLSNALNEYMICHNNDHHYYGDYAELIEQLSDCAVNLNVADFTPKRKCKLIN